MYIARALVLVVVAGVLALPVQARADAIEGPPRTCPHGSHGSSDHGGPYCRAEKVCTTNADCGKSEVCEDAALCLHVAKRHRGQGRMGDREEVTASCKAGETCSDGAPCVAAKRCIATYSAPPARKGCAGCAVGEGGAAGVPLAALVVAIGWVLRRRRERLGR